MLDKIKQLVKKYLTVKIVSSEKTPVIYGDFLKEKNALIIGAGGIGKAIATTFVQNGCNVVVTGTNENKLDETCQEIGSNKVKKMIMNVTAIDSIEQKIQDAVDLLGRIDILVYAAGVHGHDPFGEVTEATWDTVLDINLKGMYFIDQAISSYMIKNNIKGHILNIGSASCAKPGWTPYEISKNAVRSLTLGFADKLIKYGIVVNSIAPGPVATSMLNMSENNLFWPGNPCGRVATPEEIANIALIMVSDMGNLIVGDTYFVSGGSGTICIDR
jgi:3-oxoacyl-[acyl-carrier protein] reductase